MKIVYDQVSSDYRYSLSKKEVRSILEYLHGDIREKIKQIRFGCNIKTTQEAKLTKRGQFYDIRINFCLNNCRSLILSDDKLYYQQVERFGGKIDFSTRYIFWDSQGAKRYTCFLIFHEVGHVLYCEQRFGGRLSKKGSPEEEKWCDNYAINCLDNLLKENRDILMDE